MKWLITASLILNLNCFILNFKSNWFKTELPSTISATKPNIIPKSNSIKASNNVRIYNSTLDISYGIILDAGSTGTRLFIYEWDPPSSCHYSPYVRGSKFRSGPRQGKQIKIKKIGGLHTIEPSKVKDYLSEFLEFALDYVPKAQHHRTPIFLLATAGMRVIPKPQAHEILEEVRLSLNSTDFYFDKTYGAIVIPGEYEGVFGWLATNYLSNNLNHHDKHFTSHHDDDDNSGISRAYFDMGGASTQITFEPNFMPYEHSFPINMNGTSRVVYTHSFLKFGRNEARKRYWNLLSNLNNNNEESFNDPCLAGLFKHDTLIEGSGRTITGTGDFQECLKLTANLVNEESECFYSQCTIYGIHLSPIPSEMELYFTANFFDTSDFFDLSGEQTLQKLLEKVPEICNLNKFQFLAKYNKKKFQRDKDFYFYCFNMAYYINLLTHGYHIDLNRKIVFTETVEETDISWTLGAMIYEVHLLYPSGQCCDDFNDFRNEHPLVKGKKMLI